MQTFLPYPSFAKSASCLDNKRLGKQRVEAAQILRTLKGEGNLGWKNHPAVRMWEGFEDALGVYYDCVLTEWMIRGFNNNMAFTYASTYAPPHWLGYGPLHASHRSNLLRKDPIHYMIFGWEEPDDLPYYWPTPKFEESVHG